MDEHQFEIGSRIGTEGAKVFNFHLRCDQPSGIKDKPSRACVARRTDFESLVIVWHLK